MAETSGSLRICFGEIEKMSVYAYKRKYINVLSSNNFLLLGLEEMKSFIYRVETPNVGIGL